MNEQNEKPGLDVRRFWLGSVSVVILAGMAVGIYLLHRQNMEGIDWFGLYVTIGLIGGVLFYLIDPLQTQSFRWKKTISLGGAAAVGASFMLLAKLLSPVAVGSSDFDRVVLIDSPDKLNVYDDCRFERGGTNANELLGVLAVVPNLRLSAERVIPAWAGEEKLLRQKPDLIVIHASSFWPTPNYENRFKQFLKKLAESENIQFVVYSRTIKSDDEDQQKVNFESLDTRLKDRIQVFSVFESKTFMDPTTAERLRAVVREILGI